MIDFSGNYDISRKQFMNPRKTISGFLIFSNKHPYLENNLSITKFLKYDKCCRCIFSACNYCS